MLDLKKQIIFDDQQDFTPLEGETQTEPTPCKPATIFPDNVSFTPDELEIVEDFNLQGRIDFDNADFIPDEETEPEQAIRPAVIIKSPKP
tara:strand:- start:144741 stop:145010 length:270 start_codon:yes stop_codon:yes gene_type:complete